MHLFTDHPAEAGESYAQHMRYAGSVGIQMIVAGIACTIHGLLPFLFKSNGSNAIAELHSLMMKKRNSTYVKQLEIAENSVQTPDGSEEKRQIPLANLDRAA